MRIQQIFHIFTAIMLLQMLNGSLAYRDSDEMDIGSSYSRDENFGKLRLWLTISARNRFLEVSWKNAPADPEDLILLTKQLPERFERVNLLTETPLAPFETTFYEGSGEAMSTTTELSEKFMGVDHIESSGMSGPEYAPHWISNGGENEIVVAIRPTESSQWFTTGVYFDYELSANVTVNTGCYGYWASYINESGKILATTCIRAFPRWMNDMRSIVGSLRIRDIFIPGTHDSGSYRLNFDPLVRETLVTKYALTQDDDIRGQLMHGVRYLDIRVGYYRATPELFFINHGITRQRPLLEVIQQVKEFVLETNEIVIFGLKEFPIGFGKGLGVHRLLVSFLREQFQDLYVHPSATWGASLRDMWTRRQNVILAYDKPAVVREFPHLLFNSVEQRWGNVRNWSKLEQHLRLVNSYDISRFSSRPVADMAELTPDAWGVILDQHGGLRKMADKVNWRISQLYRDELGRHANIVAVDFIRGTSIIETAIDWNRRKISY